MLADTKRKLGQVVYVDMVCVCVEEPTAHVFFHGSGSMV